MLCRTALGKLPLVLTSLANRTIDENLEARAKVIQSTEAVPNSLCQLPRPGRNTAKSFPLSIHVSLSRACTNLSYLPRHPDVDRHGNSGA